MLPKLDLMEELIEQKMKAAMAHSDEKLLAESLTINKKFDEAVDDLSKEVIYKIK